jgi:hypothetical protein
MDLAFARRSALFIERRLREGNESRGSNREPSYVVEMQARRAGHIDIAQRHTGRALAAAPIEACATSSDADRPPCLALPPLW